MAAAATFAVLLGVISQVTATGSYDFSDAWKAPRNGSVYPKVRHTVPGNQILHIGNTQTDVESEATANAWNIDRAVGDDLNSADDESEDWYRFPVPTVMPKHILAACADIPQVIDVTVSGAGFFNAWLDFHGDGFTDSDRIGPANEFISSGTIKHGFSIPCDAWISWSYPGAGTPPPTTLTPPTYSRFRFSSTPMPQSSGFADLSGSSNPPVYIDGEVEDHMVDIVLAKADLDVALLTVNHPNGGDVMRGGPLQYQTNVKNVGDKTAHNVVVTTTLPSGVQFTNLDSIKTSSGTPVAHGACTTSGTLFSGISVACPITDNIVPAMAILMLVNAEASTAAPCYILGSASASTTDPEYTLVNNSDALTQPIVVRPLYDSWDGGDAPDSYITKNRALPPMPTPGTPTPVMPSTGPRHWSKSGVTLGQHIDTETVFNESVDADMDDITLSPDDEDGIDQSQGPIILTPGATNTLTVTIGGPGTLSAWIDLYADSNGAYGKFEQTDRVAHNVHFTSAGTQSLSFFVPATRNNVVSYARLRFVSSDETVDEPADLLCAPIHSGEVEDFKVLITSGGGGADLEVVKSDIYDPVALGEPFAYFIDVGNRGFAPAIDVFLDDLIPSQLNVTGQPILLANGMSSLPSGYGCSYNALTRRVLCTFPVMKAGAKASVAISTTARTDAFASPTVSTVITNTAATTATPEPTNMYPNVDSESTRLIVPCKVDLVLALDVSFSIPSAGIPWSDLQNASKALLDALHMDGSNPDNKAAIIRFGADAITAQTLTTNRTALNGILSSLPGGPPPDQNSTDLFEALQAAESELTARGRPDAIPLIVIISDGDHTTSNNTLGQVLAKAKSLRQMGTRIHGIKLGAGIGDVLRQLSTPGYYRTANGQSAPIGDQLTALAELYCPKAPVPSTTPSPTVTRTPTPTPTPLPCVSGGKRSCEGECDTAPRCRRLVVSGPITHPAACDSSKGFDLDVFVTMCNSGNILSDVDVWFFCANGSRQRLEVIGFDQGSGVFHLSADCVCPGSQISHIKAEGGAPGPNPMKSLQYQITCCGGQCP